MGPIQDDPVFFGGPVQTDRGFVLHTPKGGYGPSIEPGDVALTTSRDVLQEIAQGQGQGQLLVTLGSAGSGPGHLDRETPQHAWLTTHASMDILYHNGSEGRRYAALGFSVYTLVCPLVSPGP